MPNPHKKYGIQIHRAIPFDCLIKSFKLKENKNIQKISFDNFNEGTQFKNTIYKTQGLTIKKVKIIGADAIYAINKNRVFATSNKIMTDFKPKGKPSKNHKIKKTVGKNHYQRKSNTFKGKFWKRKRTLSFKKDKSKNKENRNSLEYILQML